MKTLKFDNSRCIMGSYNLGSTMVRNYQRKTERGKASLDQYRAALREMENGISLREAARHHNLCAMTLSRYKKKTTGPAEGIPPTLHVPSYGKHRQVFNPDQEQKLAQYLQESAVRHFGLSLCEARKMAYQCALKFNINCPQSWLDNEVAGVDWLLGFRKRHKLSLRVAENTSLARSIGFNRPCVDRFFTNLLEVMDRHKFGPDSIYNVDETGVTTVPDSGRVIAKEGTRSVGRIVSAEKGTLVTLVCAINAVGNSVPPMFIFPRKNYRDHFLHGAPPGSVGIANGSGWIKEDNFLQYLQHFARNASPSAEKPILLVLDNHISHLYIPAIDFCRENYITLLSIPPHSSHKLQPLDRVVYGPFKAFVNNRSHAWMRENPGKPMTIYDVPVIVGTALPRAMLQANIIESFRCTGIWPVNRDIFSDADFAGSLVTERPLPTQDETVPSTSSCPPPVNIQPASVTPNPMPSSIPTTSSTQPTSTSCNARPVQIITSHSSSPNSSPTLPAVPSTFTPSTASQSEPASTSPAQFNPHLVMAIPHVERKDTASKSDRRKRKSEILTDSPVKNLLTHRKVPKSSTSTAKYKGKGKVSSKKSGPQKGKTSKKVESSSESESEEYFCIVCMEAYGNSRPGEGWIACSSCGNWAHEECTDIGARNFVFVCQNCDSD